MNNVFLIYLILNGNLKLKHRKVQLQRWFDKFKELKTFNLEDFNLKTFPLINLSYSKITIEDGWLSGFTEADGCFSLRISKQRGKDYVKINCILDQKNGEDVLNEISMIFCNKKLAKLRDKKNIENMYRIEMSCNDIKKLIYKDIINYYSRYKLKTLKRKSFEIWKEVIYIVLGKQPLIDPAKILYIRKLRKTNNKYLILTKKIGKSNK